MLQSKHYIVLLCLLLMLPACETYINYKGEITEPRLVVFAQADAGDTLVCQVAHSIFFLHDTLRSGQGDELRIYDAQVSWQINNQAWNANSDGSLVAQSGDTVRLKVKHPDYPLAEAVQVLPYKEGFQVDEWQDDGNSVSTHLTFNEYPGTITDIIAIEAYGEVYDKENDTTWIQPLSIESADPLFLELNTREEGLVGLIANHRQMLYLLASSMPASGNLTVYKPYNNDSIITLYINCHTITADAYRYYKTMEDNNSFFGSVIGFGVEEKVQVFGNVSNAIGIFIATADNMLELNIINPKK